MSGGILRADSVRRPGWRIPAALGLLVIAVGAQAWDREPDTAGQALIGVATFGDGDLAFETGGPDGTESKVEISSMPLVGVAGQMPLAGDRLTGGIEGGILFGWRGRDSRTSSTNGTAVVRVDVAMSLVDLFFGGFANLNLGERSRLYAGAGPVLLFGRTQIDRFQDNGFGTSGTRLGQTESSFGFGVYGRAGCETRVSNGMLGLGARVIQGSLDFDQVSGDLDVTGVQGMLTFTLGW